VCVCVCVWGVEVAGCAVAWVHRCKALAMKAHGSSMLRGCSSNWLMQLESVLLAPNGPWWKEVWEVISGSKELLGSSTVSLGSMTWS
jgi:hypothetical protein